MLPLRWGFSSGPAGPPTLGRHGRVDSRQCSRLLLSSLVPEVHRIQVAKLTTAPLRQHWCQDETDRKASDMRPPSDSAVAASLEIPIISTLLCWTEQGEG